MSNVVRSPRELRVGGAPLIGPLCRLFRHRCGPCKQLEPIVEQLAAEYQGRLKVGSVDVEESPDTAVRYRVLSVPTIILIKNGEVNNQVVGVVPKGKLADMIAQVI
jgi:thioredoxin 1